VFEGGENETPAYRGAVTQEKARKGAAKQAAGWWGKWPIDIKEVQMVVVGASYSGDCRHSLQNGGWLFQGYN